jgi:aminocarboxymuconate-semialdehyde decarboxylase
MDASGADDTVGPVHAGGPVDIHAHMMPRDLSPSASSGPWPRLEIDADGGSGRIMIRDQAFRRVGQTVWDVDARVHALDEAGISVQVVSPVPVTLTPAAPAADVSAYLREQNDLLAAMARQSSGRLRALGAVPLADPPAAAEELHRLAAVDGIAGVEIGTLAGDRPLDHPDLEPFFAAAEGDDMPVFVHPIAQATVTYRRDEPYVFGMGMHTDTGLAGAALVFGGVLERFPRLRIALAHGCGSLPWTYPRLRYGAPLMPGYTGPADQDRFDQALRRLWCDTLVFDLRCVPLLVDRFGADHLLVGTDFPFMPTPLGDLADVPRRAADTGLLSPAEADRVGRANAEAFLGARYQATSGTVSS